MKKNDIPVTFIQEYNFQEAYNVDNLNGTTLQQAVNQIDASSEYYMKYLTHQYVYYPWHRGNILCGVSYQMNEDYTNCVDEVSDDEN